MSSKKKGQNFLVQGSILAAASIVSRLIGLIYRVPLTNIIKDTGMGYYQFAFEIYSILLIISSYSIPLAVSKLVSARVAKGEYKNAQYIFKHALRFALGIGLIVGAIDYFGAPFFVRFSKYTEAAFAIRTLAPTLVIMSVLGVFRGYFQGLGTMMPTATSNIFEQIANAIMSIAAAYILFQIGLKSGQETAYGAAGGTIGTGVGAFTALLVVVGVYLLYRRTMKKKIRRDAYSDENPVQDVYKVLILTIVPVILSTAVYNISGLLDGLIFSNAEYYKGVEESVYTGLYGSYSAKYRVLINVPTAIAASLSSAIIPTLIASIARKDYRDAKRKISYSLRFVMIISIPCAVGMAVLARPIMTLIFGVGGADVDTPARMMQIGAISIVFYSISTITNAVLQGIDKMKVPVIHAAISVVVHILLLVFLLLVCKMSIMAVVVADAFFALMVCILNALAMKKYLNYRQEWMKTFVLPGLSAGIMGVAAFLVYKSMYRLLASNLIAIMLSVMTSMVIYACLLLVFNVVNEDEILHMPKGHTILRLLKKIHFM